MDNAHPAKAPRPRMDSDPLESGTFDDFFGRHFGQLRRLALQLGADSEAQANDAAQDAMLQLYKRWPPHTNPLAWAKKATINCLINVKKRERRRDELHRKDSPCDGIDIGTADLSFNMWEDAQWVKEMLNALPESQRAIMALVVDDYAPADIAVMLGKTPGAVRANLFKARQSLIAVLDLSQANFRAREETR